MLLVPRAWRETVREDVDSEARDLGRGDGWAVLQTARAGLSLRRASIVEAMATDTRHALRSLVRARWFTVGAVLTFALGIGANVAVLSVVDRMLFRPMPYVDPDRLVQAHRSMQSSRLVLDSAITTRWRLQARSVEDVAYAVGGARPGVMSGFGDAPVFVTPVTYNLLSVLGVRPIAGRDFALDDVRAKRRLLILSEGAWRARFGGDPAAIGRVVSTDTTRYEIVGVLPPDFLLPSSALMARLDGLELLLDPLDRPAGDGWINTAPVARLRPGATAEAATAELTAIATAITEAEAPMIYRSLKRSPMIHVVPLRTGILLQYRGYVWLLVARSRSRERDAAVRAALGASRARLAVAAAVELALVCLTGAAVATLAFALLRQAMLSSVPEIFRSFAVAPYEPRVVGLTLLLAIGASLVAAVAPARRVLRIDTLRTLAHSDRTGRSTTRSAGPLLVLQTALGVLLVTGAAVTGRNVVQMMTTDPGYRADRLLLVDIEHGARLDPPGARPGPPPISAARLSLVEAALASVPGVERVGVFSQLPLLEWGSGMSYFWRDRGAPSGGVWGVATGVFETLETPVLAGRLFTAPEVAGRARVAVVNVAGVAVLWPATRAADAIGRHVTVSAGLPAPETRVIIGVVADTRPSPTEPSSPELYLPIGDDAAYRGQSRVSAVIRVAPGARPTRAQFDAVLDERLGPARTTVAALSESLDPYLQQPRFQALLFLALAGIALGLAAAGLYAIASFDAAERRHEMSIRTALGATAAQVRAAVLRSALRPVLVGTIIGLMGAWWVARFVQAFLFEVSARDPLTFAVVAVVLIGTAILAAWIPARRASRTDPAAVLRG
jgi:putative ABC transport system permease protein